MISNIFSIFNRALSDVEKQNWFKMLPIKLVTKNWLISTGLLWMIKSMENPSLAVTLAMKSLVNSHGQMVLSPKLFWMVIGCWLKVSTVWVSDLQIIRIEKAPSILKINDFLFLKIGPIFVGSQIFHYKRYQSIVISTFRSTCILIYFCSFWTKRGSWCTKITKIQIIFLI